MQIARIATEKKEFARIPLNQFSTVVIIKNTNHDLLFDLTVIIIGPVYMWVSDANTLKNIVF